MIALPAPDTQWPPAEVAKRYARFPVLGAWYAGDPDVLSGAHGAVNAVMTGGPRTTINKTGTAPRAQYVSRQRFWASDAAAEVNTKRHLPLPEDIARIVAKSLYSEPGVVKVQGPTYPEDGAQQADGSRLYYKGDPMPETVAAQKRLDLLLAKCNFQALLLAAAEIGSAMGSYGLRVAYDKTSMVRPVITRVDADASVPIYEWGQLVGVMFWHVVRQDTGGTIWRHIELHAQGSVWHGLYKGDAGNLGQRRLLAENAATAGLANVVDDQGKVTILADPLGKTATSIPNMLPDPLDRASNAGRSDYTPAMVDLFEAADKVFSQMMDEVDDARSRILVAKSLLTNNGAGQGVSFDLSQRVFTSVNTPPAEREGGGLPIEQIQFEMRVEQYLMLLNAITAKAIGAAGYQADSSTSDEGKVMTATEFDGRDSGNRSTRDQRIRYAQNELGDVLTGLLQVDVEVFGSRDPVTNQRIQAYPVTYEFPEAVQPTVLQLTEVAKALKESGAADLFERVKALHPDWSEGQIRDQADKIRNETQAIDPSTFGVGGAFL